MNHILIRVYKQMRRQRPLLEHSWLEYHFSFELHLSCLSDPSANCATECDSSGMLLSVASAFCVAPFIAIGDQAIVENASGRMTLAKSVASSFRLLAFRPHQFFTRPAFLLLLGVYGGTYLAVNTVATVCDRQKASPRRRETSKFVFVSLTNLTLNISKDRVFSRLFGQGRHVRFRSSQSPRLGCATP